MANLIWASSFVLIKIVLQSMGPLHAAGLRYFLGFLLLAPFLVGPGRSWPGLPARLWLRLLLMGISVYTIGNGALNWGLQYLSATTSSFLLSLMPLLILLAGVLWLGELPSRWQIAGLVIGLAGSGLFFSNGLRAGEPLGLALMGLALASFTLFGILGREIAREAQVSTLLLTAIPLAGGGGLLLLIALPVEGVPAGPAGVWLILLILAGLNTAFAYIIYNHALQVLTALEMNAMSNLSPLATAGLAWLFLDERLTFLQVLGMITVILGVALVQWSGRTNG